MEDWGVVADREHWVDLVGGKGTHPFPTNTQGGGVGHTLDIVDVAKFLMNGDAATVSKCAILVIGTNIFGFCGQHYAYLETYANLNGILDAETKLQGNLSIGWVDLIALEILYATVFLVY